MFFADLHIHSRFSRGTSKDLTVSKLEEFARLKGVGLLGTGDFTHPSWISELKAQLHEENGVLKTKSGFPFVLSTELSSIYSQDGKGRRIHQVILAPHFDAVDQITESLLKHGRVDYDGRPIFKLPAPEVVEMARDADKNCEVFPAHIWTPWFSMFGSNSGFDTMKDCYADTLKHVHAIETGLSSDPEMNWRLSQLDKMTILSFSDLHSFWPWRIGRELTQFDGDITYENVLNAIRKNEVVSTIEVDPNYGKYHVDGHRNCGVRMSPEQARKVDNICPKCGKQLTIGVLHRVEELADREEGYKPQNAKPFKTLLPLSEIISSVLSAGIATQKTWSEFNSLVEGTNELNVLLEMPEETLRKRTSDKIADAILRNRVGEIEVSPGYDGVYGKAVFDGTPGQKTLSDY